MKGGKVMYRVIHIDSDERIKRISDLASKEPYEIFLSNSTTMLNAKSILGLCSLVGQNVNIVAEDNADPYRFMRVVDKMMG